MKIQAIRTGGWRNFAGPVEANFEGVSKVVVTGVNGSGKSTLLVDIPMWVLFGRRLRGDSDSVYPQGCQEAHAEVDLTIDDVTYRVERCRSHGTMSASVTDVATGEVLASGKPSQVDGLIVDLLGVDADLFLSTVVLAQGDADSFMSATPAARQDVLTKLLGLDRFVPLHQKAGELAKQQSFDVVESETNLRRLAEMIETFDPDRLSETEQEFADADEAVLSLEGVLGVNTELQQTIRDEISEAAVELDRATSEVAEIDNRLRCELDAARQALGAAVAEHTEQVGRLEHLEADSVTLRLEAVRRLIPELEAQLEAVRSEGNQLLDRVRELKTEMDIGQARYDELTKRFNALKADSEDGCWVCGQTFPRDVRASLMNDTMAEMDVIEPAMIERQMLRSELKAREIELRDEKTRIGMLLDAQRGVVAELETKNVTFLEQTAITKNRVADLARTSETWRQRITELETNFRPADRTKLVEAQHRFETAKARLVGLPDLERLAANVRHLRVTRDEKSAAFAVAQDRAKRHAQHVEVRDELVSLLATQKQRLEALSLVTQAMHRNGIPAILASQSVALIEQRANEYLAEFDGAPSIRMVWSDSGRLSIAVCSDIERDYETYSGGEKYRVDIAVRLALTTVLCDAQGVAHLGTLIIDEGWGALDTRGHCDLVELLARLDQFDLIATITHIPEIADKFSYRIEMSDVSDAA